MHLDKVNQSLIKKEVERFLQYANKWPDATMRIRASNMKLVCHSDGSYLSESEARSRAGGILFLSDCADNEAPNAPVCFLSVIIKTVVTSATATEYAAAFIVGQAAISIINTLTDLGMVCLHIECSHWWLSGVQVGLATVFQLVVSRKFPCHCGKP